MSNPTTASTTTTRSIVVTATAPVASGAALLEAAYGGSVTFHKVREAGTLRRWTVLAPESEARIQAEAWVARMAEDKSVTVSVIAKEVHKSVATVRRALVALAFTQELEGMAKGERAALAKAATAAFKEAKAAAEAVAVEVEVEVPAEGTTEEA